jgi:TolB-like protein
MDKRTRGKTHFSALLLAVLVLAACAGSPAAVRPAGNAAASTPAATRPTSTPTAPIPVTAEPARTAAASTPASVYWTGNGAADLSLAVLVPEGKGLAANEAYLPTMVQGVLVGDFTKFSAMKVLDRQNLEKVIAEGESGYYANESNFVQLGTVTNVQYVLNGALQKTGSGFSLQLKITEAASGASKAAYTGNVPAAELEDLSGVKKASAELLAQLGVSLSEAGKTGLLGVVSSSAVQAETALARGITAQQSGTVVEALSYYYEAAKFDPGLAEAASRSSVLSADIQGGNIGQNVRNDIQRRAAWVKTLDEAAAFFKNHPPYEIIYDPALTPGEIDYNRGTVEMSFQAVIIGTAGLKVTYDLDQGLEKTGKSKDWGISVRSIYRTIPERYEFTAVLINEGGETIGRTTGRFTPSAWYNFSFNITTVTFWGVNADKITDKLTVSITSINGMDAKTAGERGYMSISTGDLSPLELYSVDWRFGDFSIKGIRQNMKVGMDIVIPSKILRWPITIEAGVFANSSLSGVTIPDSVTSIGERAFARNKLTGVTIPDSVTSIGAEVFADNKLTSVTIPASVTSIGAKAFADNELTSVTIPASVVSIGADAFSGNRLTSVTIPASVTSIGERAFAKNELTSITILGNVTSIGKGAFPISVTDDGPALTITIPANMNLYEDIFGGSRYYWFVDFYNANGKKAGTYEYKNHDSFFTSFRGFQWRRLKQ